ncbi:calmodulin-binding receptor-like cytoplasmic kinase 2 [Physcomitrium patens]|uniref:calmodulin-binding receptor-like cytoplasmic kinase 2 n=1 Tax=Physcomitrium patens TaxID=3218 RepID=UPI003CCE13BA
MIVLRTDFIMWCVCQSKTIDDDDGLIYRNKVYVKDFSTQSFGSTEPGSLHGSVRRYSLSSQDPPPKLLGAETFTMAELYRVTENFSPQNKIGQGGFGMVYKGRLRDGRMVAIKRGKKDAYEARLSVEFRTEVEMLSQVDHLNLVKLIGYTEEDDERILVVDYVANGNLGEHLDGTYSKVLDMRTRLDIAIDVAHALTYLHLYADRPIIHRDIKSSNILLTSTCRAKVADFGFSRVGPSVDAGATHVSTQVKGTVGYLDPEYLNTFQLNAKSDVYSFGILLLEIFTGRRPIELKRPSDERVTALWAFRKFVLGKLSDIIDPKLEKTPAVLSVIERLAELAFACSASSKVDRPSMKKAAEVLWEVRKDYLVEHQKEEKLKSDRDESIRIESARSYTPPPPPPVELYLQIVLHP